MTMSIEAAKALRYKESGVCLGLSGPVSGGKTTLVKAFAGSEVDAFLTKAIHEKATTICPHRYVFLQNLDHIVVRAIPKVQPLGDGFISEILYSALVDLIYSERNHQVTEDHVREKLTKKLQQNLQNCTNVNSGICLLSAGRQQEILNQMTDLLIEKGLSQSIGILFNGGKNHTTVDHRESPTGLKAGIREYLSEWLKDQTLDEDLHNLCEEVNQELTKLLVRLFGQESTAKGFYREVPLDGSCNVIPENGASEEEFLNYVFADNNTQLSIEPLCEELVIFLPISDMCLKAIEKSGYKEVFSNALQEITFTVLDTQGLFHQETETNEDTAYRIEKLWYDPSVNALLLLAPLDDSTGLDRNLRFYQEIMKTFHRQIPVFLVHNKVDLYLHRLWQNWIQEHPDTDISEQTIRTQMEEEMSRERQLLIEAQPNSRKDLQIHSLPMHFKPCMLFQFCHHLEGLKQEYAPSTNLGKIFTVLGRSLRQNANRLTFNAANIEFTIDREELQRLFRDDMKKNQKAQTALQNALFNIQSNTGLTPHGLSFYAGKNHARYGEGFTSNLTYPFIHCQNIRMTFPEELARLISVAPIQEWLPHVLHFNPQGFDDLTFKSFCQLVSECCVIQRRDFVKALIYDRVLQKNDNAFASFYDRFQRYLSGTRSILSDPNYTDLIDALIRLLEECVQRIFNTRVFVK